MINRYDCPEISNIWTDENRFRLFLEVELAHLETLESDFVPAGTSKSIREKSTINVSRIEELERTTRHDVVAFISHIMEQVSDDESRFFHYGLTSSDVIDTALSLQIKESVDAIGPIFKRLLDALSTKASEHKQTLCMGRSHGIMAEPTSFGVKLLGHFAEFKRRFDELCEFKNELTAQFSGSIGNFALISPAQEMASAKRLGLKVESVSTQVIPRDRHAKLLSILTLNAQAIERIAVELRHLQRTEVNEVCEGFSSGQKGSSTMPHKKNPISAENLTGIARVIRSHLSIALDNCVLWHERDISHSSAERLYLPDALGLSFYAIKRLTTLIADLVVNREVMENNLTTSENFASSYYLHYLLKNTALSRDEIYPIVQRASFSKSSIKEEIESELNINLPSLSTDKIHEIYLKHVEEVFNRTITLNKDEK